MISAKDFVKAHFEEYIGKMYHTEGAPFIWFAFDKGTTSLDALQGFLRRGVSGGRCFGIEACLEWYRRRCSGVRKANRLVFGTETGLLRYGILLLLRRLLGEFKDCRGKVAVAAGILVEVVLVVLLGFVETAEGL